MPALEPGFRQTCRHCISGSLGGGVNDSGPSDAAQRVQRRTELSVVAAGVGHLPAQVRPVESFNADHRVAHGQSVHDVAADARGRGRGDGDEGRARKEKALGAQPAVGGPEVVAPLGNAVRLVHDDESDAHASDAAEEVGRVEAFWRYVDEAQLAALQRGHPVLHLALAQRAVEVGRRDPRETSPSIWSFISEMRGDTTSVTPLGTTSAGIWYVSDFPPPVGTTESRSRPSRTRAMAYAWCGWKAGYPHPARKAANACSMVGRAPGAARAAARAGASPEPKSMGACSAGGLTSGFHIYGR
jgi:hypothetical protein